MTSGAPSRMPVVLSVPDGAGPWSIITFDAAGNIGWNDCVWRSVWTRPAVETDQSRNLRQPSQALAERLPTRTARKAPTERSRTAE